MGLFHLAWCLWGSPVLQQVSEPPSSLRSNNIPGYEWTTFCVLSHLSIHLCVLPPSGYFEWGWYEHGAPICIWGPAFPSFGCVPRCGMAGPYGNAMFKCLRNHRIDFPQQLPHFLIPTSKVQSVQLLCILLNTCYFVLFLIIAIGLQFWMGSKS